MARFIYLDGAFDADLRALLLGPETGDAASDGAGLRVSEGSAAAQRIEAWAEIEGVEWTDAPDRDAVVPRLPDRDPALTREIAAEIFALWPARPVEELTRRRGLLAVRAQARLNARANDGPTTLRHRAQPSDVQVEAFRQPYGAFFSIEEYDLTHRHFDGSRSGVLTRAGFISGDAVVVLPYDPVRDRVLLVEQFRLGPFARGDRQPWSLEAVAGRIDPGETPAQSARREAEEEAGLTLGDLIPLSGTYPSPGAVAEYLYNFIALTDLPDRVAGIGGLDTEGEDIRSHVLPFERMMALIESGEINNGPLIVIALMLDRRRAALRAAGESAPSEV